MNRRLFFGRTGRIAMLALLAGGTAALATQQKISLTSCGDKPLCRQCGKFGGCGLDAAKEARKVEQKTDPI